MKSYLIIIVFGFIGLSCFSQGNGRTKRALLFGIGNYPKANGWPTISSLIDLGYMENTLINQGFRKENIRKVIDDAATVQGISEAFVQLIKEINPGDIVVIHFSCHGEQLKADNNNKIDGLDECVVSYNAVSPYKSTNYEKDQTGYLRGHVLGEYVRQLRTKLGNEGDVIILLDFCHSGGGTRGISKIRGGQPPLTPKGFDINSLHKASDSSLMIREMNTIKGDEHELASITVLSATRPEELDYETQDDNGVGMGSLTYAICKSFERLPSETTYRSLFSNIQAVMNVKVPSQHPLLEGNGADRLILGGAFITQKPYFEITKIRPGNEWVVKAGNLAGLDSGAKLSFYPAGTNDPSGSDPLASGIVIHADSYFATVQLNKDPAVSNPALVWAFITQPIYNIRPISIEIVSEKSGDAENNFSSSEVKQIKKYFQDLPIIKFDGSPQLLIVKGRSEDSIKIASNGYLFSSLKSALADSNKLREEILRYAQYKFLQELDVKDVSARVEVKLVPVLNGVPDISKINSRIVNGVYEYTDEDILVLWVKNTGGHSAYINILDMQPDGVINKMLPNREKKIYSYNLKLDPGQEHLFSDYMIKVAKPCGTEVLKIFTSTVEIDVEDIVASRGVTPRGNLSVLEKLIQNSYSISTRGLSVNRDLGNANGTTYNLLLRIKPKPSK